jgi:hypothetical protein
MVCFFHQKKHSYLIISLHSSAKPQRLPKAQVGTIAGGQHTSGGRNIQNRSKSYDRKLQRQRYKILQRQE